MARATIAPSGVAAFDHRLVIGFQSMNASETGQTFAGRRIRSMSVAAAPGGRRYTGSSTWFGILSPRGEITELLARWREGEEEAPRRLFELVYGELRIMARRRLAGAGDGRTLSPSVLVHESYLKLVGATPELRDRSHFYALAARAMRQIVVDHARRRQAAKRGGAAKVLVDQTEIPISEQQEEILALDEALCELREIDERLARVVELRFFGGLTVEEIAGVLEVSTPTVKRDWRKARAFLLQALRESGSAAPE